MRAHASELRIPADPAFVVVAKRAAAGFGCAYGFGVEEIDDLTIAVGQACENAITLLSARPGPSGAQLRLLFEYEGGRLQVKVTTTAHPHGSAAHSVSATPPDETGAGQGSGPYDAARVADGVGEWTAAGAPASRPLRAAGSRDVVDSMELSLRVMSLFVDDCRYRMDSRTGGLNIRLIKYRIS